MGSYLSQIDAQLSPQANKSMPQNMQNNAGIVDTFLGRMHRPNLHENLEPENVKKIIDMVTSSMTGGNVVEAGKAAMPYAKAGMNYLNPGKAAEEFRSTLGQGTSSENIAELGKRMEFAKKSAKEEALIPKRELYQQEGKSDIFKVNEANLPEGNLPKIGEMIEPGGQFQKSQMDALSKALKGYRKNGSIESFLEHGEDIFNVPEIPNKAAQKIEEALLMPTKRGSSYFSEKGVADFYGKKGLKTLHDAFEKKPTLNNYDELQSAIKKNIRKLTAKEKAKTIDSAGDEKLESLRENAKNLNKDKEEFMKTLPQKMQNLENEFRTKYAKNVAPYEEAGLTIRKLAEGRASEVSPAQVTSAFTKMNVHTKKILQDLGAGAGRNILYNALQKVQPGDAKAMADTILDLKRTKGFDQFVTPEMERWADKMQKQARNSELIKDALKLTTGAFTGGLIGGAPGAIIGAGLPFAKEGAIKIAKKFKK